MMKLSGILRSGIQFLLCCMIWIPITLLAAASFMPEDELMYRYSAALGLGKDTIRFSLLPSYPTIQSYKELLLYSPGFFVMFWNSCIQVFPTLAGQLMIAAPASWSFAKYPTKAKRVLFSLYIVLMILPFQVMMVSNYLVLGTLNLLDSHLSLILPGIWSTLPVFIMAKFFEGIPQTFIEAAHLDGANELCVFFHIALPLGKPGIITAFMLGFFEAWNALEQPIAYLQNRSLWPLSLYLPNITADKASVAFAASVVFLFPSVLVFLNGQDFLEQGISSSGIKG